MPFHDRRFSFGAAQTPVFNRAGGVHLFEAGSPFEIAGYLVQRSDSGSEFQTIATIPSYTKLETFSYTAGSLASANASGGQNSTATTEPSYDFAPDRYQFRVLSYRTYGNSGQTLTSDPAGPVSAKVLPRTPSNLTLKVMDYDKIALRWADKSDHSTGI